MPVFPPGSFIDELPRDIAEEEGTRIFPGDHPIKFSSGGERGYKRIYQNMTFVDVSLLKSMEHNRSLRKEVNASHNFLGVYRCTEKP